MKDLRLRSFRSYFGIVSQQSYLFNDTIRNNLMYGLDIKEQLSAEEVRQKEAQMRMYCDKLGLGKTIEQLPHGYATNLGEQASTRARY